MIHNVNWCNQQYYVPEHLQGPGGSLLRQEYSCSYASQSLSCSPEFLSYSSETVIQSDRVSLDDSGSIPSLHLFVSHMRAAIGDILDMEKMGDYGRYDGMDSPGGVAGRLLWRIENLLFGKRTSPRPDGIKEPVPEPETTVAAESARQEIPAAQVESTPGNPDAPPVTNDSAAAETPTPGEVPVSIPEPVSEETQSEPRAESEETAPPAAEAEDIPAQAPVADEEEESDTETKRAQLLKLIEKKIDISFRETLFELSEKDRPAGIKHRFAKGDCEEGTEKVHKAYSLIKHGVNALKHRGAGPDSAANRYSIATAGYREDRTMNLEILTRDGDVVVIEIDSSLASGITRFQSEEQGVSFRTAERFGYLDENLQFSVKGDLDEGELEAIAEFIEAVGSLADTFFTYDSQAAFAEATDLGFDEEELVGFSLDMMRQRTRYAAAVIAQKNAPPAMAGRQGDRAMKAHRALDTIGDIAKKARSVFTHPVLDTFKCPEALIVGLFNIVAEERQSRTADGFSEDMTKPPVNFIKDFALKIMAGLFPEKSAEEEIISVPKEVTCF